MNLMLFERQEATELLPPTDARAAHVRGVLRMHPGDRFDVGALDGPRGKALIQSDGAEGMRLLFEWGAEPRPCLPLRVIVGLSRPQTMRKILREAPPLGIAELHVVQCGKIEAGYAASSLWTDGEWREQLLQGAEQAFTTRVPAVIHHTSMAGAAAAIAGSGLRLALDNYEATAPLHRALAGTHSSIVLAIGPERGWDAGDRAALRAAGFTLAHMGPNVLRTEAALIAAAAMAGAQLGGWDFKEESGER